MNEELKKAIENLPVSHLRCARCKSTNLRVGHPLIPVMECGECRYQGQELCAPDGSDLPETHPQLPELDAVLPDKFEDWGSTFGLSEFEDMAIKVVEFLRGEIPSKHHLLNLRGPTGQYAYERGEGWTKRFVIEDITERRHSVFAAMCVAGYFKVEWFPKWCFTVTQEFIDRCPLASYRTRLARDPKSRGYPNARNNYSGNA